MRFAGSATVPWKQLTSVVSTDALQEPSTPSGADKQPQVLTQQQHVLSTRLFGSLQQASALFNMLHTQLHVRLRQTADVWQPFSTARLVVGLENKYVLHKL